MDLRKVQEIGKGSLFATLPKHWIKKTGLSKGSLISFQESLVDNSLILSQYIEKEKQRNATISYKSGSISNVELGITGAYLLGYDSINIITTDRIEPNEREIIRNQIRKLIGFEILNESTHEISVKCLIDPTQITPAQLIQRMSIITGEMTKDAIFSIVNSDHHLAEIVVERDEEVDRLYFLLVRLLRRALQDSKLVVSLNIKPIDCLDYRVAATLIEEIGDNATMLASYMIEHSSKNFDIKLKNKLKDISQIIDDLQFSVITSFISKNINDIEKSRVHSQSYFSKINSINPVLSNLSDTDFSLLIIPKLNRIGTAYIDILDLIVPSNILIQDQ